MNRKELADIIILKLQAEKHSLKEQFNASKNNIGYFFIDDLLPEEIAISIHKNFPSLDAAISKNNIREKKYVAYQMDTYDSLLEEITFAFQDKRIVDLIGEICNKKDMFPDEFLYAGGLSLMSKGNFLNPHLDNSHDKDGDKWRSLNLLYYVTPNWELENGGNLELWPNGLKKEQTTIVSKFNRLVVMTTHKNSWHSVSKVLVDGIRCCVSNYYFSETPILATDHRHITTFRAKPKKVFVDFLLKTDNFLRKTVRKIVKKGLKNSHQYKK